MNDSISSPLLPTSAGAVPIATAGVHSTRKLKSKGLVKSAGGRVLKTACNAIGFPALDGVRDVARMVLDACKGDGDHGLRSTELARRVREDLHLVEQIPKNPQTPVDSVYIETLQNELQAIAEEIDYINDLNPLVKNLNSVERIHRMDELERAFDRYKTDLAYKYATKSMAQTREEDLSEPILYEEILSRDVEVIFTSSYQIKQQDPVDQSLVCVKSFSTAQYREKQVSIVEYSGTFSRKKKYEVLAKDLKICAVGMHANVLKLVGGSKPTTPTSHPYLVFEIGGALSYVDFLRETASLHDLIVFIRGAEQGLAYMYHQGVKYRDGISVSFDGKATIHPPGVKLSKLTGKQSTKRWVGHILSDVESEFKSMTPALPLREIYQILNASSQSLKTQVEDTFLACTIVTKQRLFDIAETLRVPLKRTWRHVTSPDCPDFIVNLGTFGRVIGDYDAGAQAPFDQWTPINYSSPVCTISPGPAVWMDKITTRVTFKKDGKPTFKDADIFRMHSSQPGWLSFENVIRNASCLNDSCSVVINYGNRPSEELDKYQDALSKLSVENAYPPREIHFIRGVNLRFIFKIEPDAVPMPVYLHRQPSSHLPKHYWGFLSQFEDPTVIPESPVSEIEISYQLDVVGALEGDSWQSRAETEYSREYAKMPGSWKF